jgi:predicted GTPase
MITFKYEARDQRLATRLVLDVQADSEQSAVSLSVILAIHQSHKARNCRYWYTFTLQRSNWI